MLYAALSARVLAVTDVRSMVNAISRKVCVESVPMFSDSFLARPPKLLPYSAVNVVLMSSPSPAPPAPAVAPRVVPGNGLAERPTSSVNAPVPPEKRGSASSKSASSPLLLLYLERIAKIRPVGALIG